MASTAKRQRVANTSILSLYPTAAPSTGDPALRVANIMAEEAVIGAVFQKPSLYASLAEIIQPADFYILSNGYIWHAFDRLNARGVGIDMVTVYTELESMGNPLAGIDVMERIAQLIQNAPNAKNAESYARDVFEAALRLRVMRANMHIVEKAMDKTATIDELIDFADHEIYKATNRQTETKTDALSVVNEYYDRMEAAVNGGASLGVVSGFQNLDAIVPSGFTQGEVTVLAGSEGMGKTTWLLTAARNMCLAGKRIGIFSLEMKKHEIVHNFMAMETGIYKTDLKTFRLNPAQLSAFAKAAGDISKWPFDVIDEYPSLTPIQLRRRMRNIWLTNPLDIVIIDGLWLMESNEPIKGDRPRDVFNIMRELNVISRDFATPILITHQYNAEVNKAARPSIFHLSESAGVRRNAQVIYGMHRDTYYNPDSKDMTTWVYVLKDRNGRASGERVPFVYNGNYSRYEEGECVSITL